MPGVPLLVVLADDDGDGVRPDGVTTDASQPITHGATSLFGNHVGQVALQKLKHKLRNIYKKSRPFLNPNDINDQ